MRKNMRRHLSGIYIFDKFAGEEKRTPTCVEDCTRQTRVQWLHTKEKEYIVNLVGMLYDTMMNIVDNEEQEDARLRMDYLEKFGAMAKSDMECMAGAGKTYCVEVADKVCHMLRRLGDTADIARAEEGGEEND